MLENAALTSTWWHRYFGSCCIEQRMRVLRSSLTNLFECVRKVYVCLRHNAAAIVRKRERGTNLRFFYSIPASFALDAAVACPKDAYSPCKHIGGKVLLLRARL